MAKSQISETKVFLAALLLLCFFPLPGHAARQSSRLVKLFTWHPDKESSENICRFEFGNYSGPWEVEGEVKGGQEVHLVQHQLSGMARQSWGDVGQESSDLTMTNISPWNTPEHFWLDWTVEFLPTPHSGTSAILVLLWLAIAGPGLTKYLKISQNRPTPDPPQKTLKRPI